MHFNVLKDIFLDCLRENGISPALIQDVGKFFETFRPDVVVRHVSILQILGGDRAINTIINRMFEKVLQDSKLKSYFKNKDMNRIKEQLRHFMTFMLGGANNFEGRSLFEIHKHLGISNQEYTVFKDLMVQQFQQSGLDTGSLGEIGNLLEAIRGDIIKRPPTLYERLGGDKAVPDAIKKFCERLLQDRKLEPYFSKVDMKNLSSQMIEFFNMITGGPNK